MLLFYIIYEKYTDALNLINTAIGLDAKDSIFWYHKGSIQLKLGKVDDAIRCFDQAIVLDSNFSEVHNAKAVALSLKSKFDESITELKQAIQLNPHLAEAHENLTKAVLFQKQETQNFIEFWSSSDSKKAIAIILGLLAISVIAYPLLFGYTSLVITDANGIISKTTTVESKIPETHIIILGLIVFILLFPEIRKAKIGPVEFEMSRDPGRRIRPSSVQ